MAGNLSTQFLAETGTALELIAVTNFNINLCSYAIYSELSEIKCVTRISLDMNKLGGAEHSSIFNKCNNGFKALLCVHVSENKRLISPLSCRVTLHHLK